MSSNLSLIEASLTFWNFSSRSLTSLWTIRLKPKNDDRTINDGNNNNSNDNNNNNNNNNNYYNNNSNDNNNNNNNNNNNSDVDDDNDDDCIDVRKRLS